MMQKLSKDLREYAPELLHPYIPDETAYQVLAGLGLLGAGGLAYSTFWPGPAKPHETLPPHKVRISINPRRKTKGLASEEEDPGFMGKFSAMKKNAELNWKTKFALGAVAPIGLYGVYSAYKTALEEQGKRRIEHKLRRLRGLSDPRYDLPKEEEEEEEAVQPEEAEELGLFDRLRSKMSSADELLGEAILEQFAEQALDKQAGRGTSVTEDATSTLMEIWDKYPALLGMGFGAGGLVTYLAANRQLLPPQNLEDRPSVAPTQLIYDVEGDPRYGKGNPMGVSHGYV